jgi:hypothetical protein
MLQLLKEAMHLSSLKINIKSLMKMFDNHELCGYLSKVIKKLDISGADNEPIDYSEIKKLCQTFSNLEEFRCDVGQSDNLEMILNELSKLSYLTIFSYKTRYAESGYDWLEKHKSELDLYIFFVECECPLFNYPYFNECYCYCHCHNRCFGYNSYDCCCHHHHGCFGYDIHFCGINSHVCGCDA